jgi:hypothetical protein
VLLAVAVSLQSPQAKDQYAAQTMVSPGSGGPSQAVALMLGRIISFTRWPRPLSTVRLCVAGATRFADRLDAAGTTASARVETQALAGQPPTRCDAVYVGALPFDARRQLIAAVHDAPILTIAEHDATCNGGTMFCLSVEPAALSFQINVDAISRSGVRIDPRVLRLSDSHDGAR